MYTIPGRHVIMALFLVFLLLPIYWLVNMSLKTNTEITSAMTLWPQRPTLRQLHRIFTDPSWYSGYINSLNYVVINTMLSITLALPAAYAFSRYRFLGDKHLFFWLLTNRMAPPAVFALPFFNLYSAIGLFDTPWAVALAHCLFNVPLAVWILEGFMSGVPREIDETAFLDGYSFPRFFVKIFMPLIASGIGVAAFFCFMFSWVELLLARTLTTVNAKPIAATMTRTVSAAGMDWGAAGGGRRADHRAGRARDLVRPQLHRQGLRARAGVRRRPWKTSPGWPGPGRRRSSSPASASCSPCMTVARVAPPGDRARRRPRHCRPRAATGCSSSARLAPSFISPGSAWSAHADRHAADRRWHRLVEPVARHGPFAGRCRGRVPHGLGRRDKQSRVNRTPAVRRSKWRKP